jgi:hypothetical protein
MSTISWCWYDALDPFTIWRQMLVDTQAGRFLRMTTKLRLRPLAIPLSAAIFAALLSATLIPIGIVSLALIRQSSAALTAEIEHDMLLLAQSRVREINLTLEGVQNTTAVAEHSAAEALRKPYDAAAQAAFLKEHQADARGIVGWDITYQERGGKDKLGSALSNVYLNGALDDSSARDIALSHTLDREFRGIARISPETQWLYLTMPSGVMRIYPYADNGHYPDGWDPRQAVFYTVADPVNNPAGSGVWTPPYVDFAGAGWMVTYSRPVFDDKRAFLGVMSHDITINSLKQLAVKTQVLDNVGYGFLIDNAGAIIAHPHHGADSDATKGAQEMIRLSNVGSESHRAAMGELIATPEGQRYFVDEKGESQLLIHQSIPAINWKFGMVVPTRELLIPVTQMRERAILMATGAAVLAALMSWLLTRKIITSIRGLLSSINALKGGSSTQVATSGMFVEFRELAEAFNSMSANVQRRESRLQTKVKELSIQIDASLNRSQVDSIAQTDYFKHLELSAGKLREHVKSGLLSSTSHA